MQGRCLAGKSGTDSKGPAQRSTAHGPRMAINNIILIFLPFFFFLMSHYKEMVIGNKLIKLTTVDFHNVFVS